MTRADIKSKRRGNPENPAKKVQKPKMTRAESLLKAQEAAAAKLEKQNIDTPQSEQEGE